jgi:hypothetical protein
MGIEGFSSSSLKSAGVLYGRQSAILGLSLAVVGSAFSVFYMLSWELSQQSLALSGSTAARSEVPVFFAVEGLVAVLIVAGVYFVYRAAKSAVRGRLTLLSVFAEAFSSKRTMRLAVALGLTYAAAFSFLSGTLVYQPTVNFAKVYGVSTPGWASAVCCGGFGSVPELKYYLSPALHLGIQLIPLTLLMLVVVPPLVTLNVAVAIESLRQKTTRTGRLATSVGALLGLVTGCPTCAGYFLLSAVGGLGASAFSFVLAPYQFAFVAVSVPLLVAAPFLTAYGHKRALASKCEVPGQKA